MTVSECLKEWLGEYQCNVDFTDILTDIIGVPTGFALSKSPNRNIVTHVDGSKLITEYYQFFARLNTQGNDNTTENEQFLSDLEEWIEERDSEEDYPDLSKAGRLTCTEIAVASTGTITSQEIDNAIYQITISIQYLKER